jgi:peptidyl-prolyl cis-trans isomerase B (cyclophilin B)
VARRDRERELARRRYERRQQRLQAQRAKSRRRTKVIASAVAILLVLSGGAFGLWLLIDNDDDESTLAAPTPTASATTSTAAQLPCTYTKTGDASGDKKVTPPDTKTIDKQHLYTATLETNRGTVAFRMPAVKAPCTVNSFRTLAGQKFFDGTECHRLTTSGIFVLQCGDPTATGSGGPGYSFPDENLPGATYKAGTVAMANSGPNTNGSQFFLVYKDTQLPPSYTPFGTITKGLDVIKKIAAKGSNPPQDGKPKEKVVIEKFTVVQTA